MADNNASAETVDVYSYTPRQAQVIRLYDTYRNCLLYVKYYGRKLKIYRRVNLWMDLATALATSSAFTGLAIMRSPVGLNALSFLLLAAAIISVVKERATQFHLTHAAALANDSKGLLASPGDLSNSIQWLSCRIRLVVRPAGGRSS
jgi:hypothetical protein